MEQEISIPSSTPLICRDLMNLDIYQASWILKFQIYFQPMMTRLTQGFMYQVSKGYKSNILQMSSYTERYRDTLRYMLHRRCRDFFCALRLCTKSLLDLQAWIDELYINNNVQVVILLVTYQDLCKGEVSTRTNLIVDQSNSSTINWYFGIVQVE